MRLARAIAEVLAEAVRAVPAPLGQRNPAPSWRERVWTCPPDTRLGVLEVAEALGRSKALVYRLTRTGQIPHRKLDGELAFRAGDLRVWLSQREQMVVTPRLTVVAQKPNAA